MIPNIRTLSQQLAQPHFDNPKDLLAWMGAMQAQDYSMAKWALGIRTQGATLQSVQQALDKGDILRTHIMRPTWHFVPTEDIRWMLKLTQKRLASTNKAYCKKFDLSENTLTKCNKLFEKILEGNNHLTKEEIVKALHQKGMPVEHEHMGRHLFYAENLGLICNGIDKGSKVTYALLDERVPPTKDLHKDEALATLATRYFQSHSPATLNDFVWWSGLSITEARHAIHLIQSQLIADKFDGEQHLVYETYREAMKAEKEILHLLPSYDEYLISYKVRTDVLDLQYYPKAFNSFGIFQPVILYNGKIIGNWKKAMKKGKIEVETSFFEPKLKVSKTLLENAIEKYRTFIS